MRKTLAAVAAALAIVAPLAAATSAQAAAEPPQLYCVYPANQGDLLSVTIGESTGTAVPISDPSECGNGGTVSNGDGTNFTSVSVGISL